MNHNIVNIDQLRNRKRAIDREIAEIEQSFVDKVNAIKQPAVAVSSIFNKKRRASKDINVENYLPMIVSGISTAIKVFTMIRNLRMYSKMKKERAQNRKREK
ncbi:MAG: hypothetical protein LBH92_02385 [Bacteroidales bacterium]|jgi:hypothetical protein|nr:hypothetical protein [Bacteroidales bacterium]